MLHAVIEHLSVQVFRLLTYACVTYVVLCMIMPLDLAVHVVGSNGSGDGGGSSNGSMFF